MRKLLALPLVTMLTLSLQASDNIDELVEKKCGECHIMGKITKEKIQNMKAPPSWALAKKVKNAYATREERVKHIISYTINPNEDIMLFPIETKKRFGVMPSQKGKITESELKAIADYILNK